MDNSVLRKTIFELKRESLVRGGSVTYTIVGSSMLFLFSMNDEVVVRKADTAALKTGDIILYSLRGATGTVEVVHRILYRTKGPGGVRFKTKGDFNLLPDAGWVEPKDIVGKICALRKISLGLMIPVDRGAGRLLSYAAGALSSITTLLWYPFRKAGVHTGRWLRLLTAERPCLLDPDGLLENSVFGTDKDGWLECVKAFENAMRPFTAEPGLRAGDVQIGGGFSEEACSLKRRGMSVVPLSLVPESSCGSEGLIDILIAARVIDLLPGWHDRRELLRRSAACLKPGGMMAVSWLRSPEPGGLLKLKRRLCSILLGERYKGPGPHAVMAGERFVRQALPARTVVSEIRKTGFDVLDVVNGKDMHLIVARKR